MRAVYRRAVKHAQTTPKQANWNSLHDNLAGKNTDQFWKEWKKLYSTNKSNLHPVVNGLSSRQDIADSFKTHFMNISKPNNVDRVDRLNADFEDKYSEACHNHAQSCNCSEHRISLDSVMDAVFSMKKGKCSDDDSIHAEHFFNAPLSLFDRLQCLFNVMLQHSFVPKQFQLGTILPIVKDRQGDLGDPHNYRGITIASIISKIFEHVLRIVFRDYLTSSAYQFGFKRKSSTSHALHCLKETINYYADGGSNVYCSFLDASKAFDRLVHSGLFLKLLSRNVPMVFIDLIIFWYSNLQCRARWGDSHSEWFSILAGVRQGGVLSPDFYCLYVDDLASILTRLNVGCHVRDVFVSILLYADDMALLAPSLRGLQLLLNACEQYCRDWDISLNHKKTKNIAFGKGVSNLCPLFLDGSKIEWVPTWKYLGVTVQSHRRFNCCINERLKAFYRSLNAIVRIEGRSNELVMLQLLESHCIPILTYAIDVIHVADSDVRRKLRVAYNAVFRKIFNYKDNESVRELQMFLNRPTWEALVEKRIQSFQQKISSSSTLTVYL